MITEDYVSFEVAKLLKEKGFDEETRGYYPIKGDATGRLMFSSEYNHNHSQVQISAPTLQMTMKWLREVHKIILSIFYCDNSWMSEYYGEEDSTLMGCYDTYEEACEAAIKYALKNLI